MKDSITKEVGIALVLGALLALLTYAKEAWMPGMATMLTLIFVVAAFSVFAVFVWREAGGDERDQYIRLIASRFAFLATGTVLLVGIVYETLMHHVPNPWLTGALAVMVFGKVIGHAYGRNNY